MPALDRDTSALLVIDFQTRLMPAIEDGAAVVANARRLLDAAELLGVPALFTEQNAGGLGPTMPELRSQAATLFHKMTFDACRMPGFLDALPARRDLVVASCETHVCVLQTALGLLAAGRRVCLVRDAVGSRLAESKETAIRRLEREAPRSSPLRWCCSSGCAPPRTRTCAASSTSSVSRVDAHRTAMRTGHSARRSRTIGVSGSGQEIKE